MFRSISEEIYIALFVICRNDHTIKDTADSTKSRYINHSRICIIVAGKTDIEISSNYKHIIHPLLHRSNRNAGFSIKKTLGIIKLGRNKDLVNIIFIDFPFKTGAAVAPQKPRFHGIFVCFHPFAVRNCIACFIPQSYLDILTCIIVGNSGSEYTLIRS